MRNSSQLSRRRFLQCAAAGAAASTLPFLSCGPTDRRPNVLFLVVDDLNDWVSFLGGHPAARTPNLERLARRGMVFTNAHCASPTCGGSRTSMLLGLEPTTTGVYGNHQDYVEAVPDAVTLPLHFKRNGYWAGAAGKVFHIPEQRSWDERFEPEVVDPFSLPRAAAEEFGFGHERRFEWGPLAASEDTFFDWRIADWVIERLGERRDRPFFLTVGLAGPHLPWFAPKSYFEPFPPEEVRLPEGVDERVSNADLLAAAAALKGLHGRILEAGQWPQAVAAYLACVYFMDTVVGRILDALERSPAAERTVVVFCSDHGYALGENSHWGKFVLWETATRVPLIVAAPGLEPGRSSRAVSLTHLFPTLTELCGLPPVEGLDGTSIVPLLQDPEAPWELPAITSLARYVNSVRTERWRYTRHRRRRELFDHSRDPDERKNLAGSRALIPVRRELGRWIPKEQARPVRALPRNQRHPDRRLTEL